MSWLQRGRSAGRYGVAIGAAAVAIVIALVFYDLVAPTPSLPFFTAVAVAAWYGGLGPGVLATVLGATAVTYLFLPPLFSFAIDGVASAVRLGGVVAVGVLISSLSARLRDAQQRAEHARSAATASEARSEAILSALAEGITVQDRGDRLSFANDAAARLCGYASAAELLAASPVDTLARFELFDEAGQPFMLERMPGRLALRGQPAPEVLMRFRVVATGEEHWALVNATPVRNSAGSVELAVNSFRDITARKQAEDAARFLAVAWYAQADAVTTLNAALRQAVDERTAALSKLEDVLRARDEFLASASHDLKNPLAGIRATVQLLERRLNRAATVDVERFSDGLRRIDATVTRASAQVEELLDVVRLQARSPLHLDRSEVDLVVLAREAVAEQQHMTERHTISLRSASTHLTGSWDDRRLRRLVANLLENAVKYSPDGGPIQVRLARVTDAQGDWAALEIEDHGLGIPPAELPRLFERFQRGSNVVDRIAGTGLGLASVQQIADSHGGRIDVSSTEGQGTAVRVRLPLFAVPVDGADYRRVAAHEAPLT